MHTHAGRGNRARFATTRWSLVLAVADRTGPPDPINEAALAALCELYWFPIYAFIRRSGRSADAAADLTQGFFAAVIEKGYFEQADRDRGRFRSFLLGSVKHFMATDFHHATRLKRGGGQPAVALEFGDGEARYSQEPADYRTPEDAYEAQWAAQVFAAARARLEDQHAQGWMRASRFFAPLLAHLLDEHNESFAEMAARLQTTDGSLRVLAYRVRKQFGVCLREVISDTVDTPSAVDGELRHLLTVLGRQE